MIKKPMIGLCIAVACMSTSIFSLSGCEPHEGSEDQLKADVDSFANYYFNWHFPKAVKYCTQESERWLRYAASNVNETDVELLRQKPEDASIEITDIDFGDDETSATVTLTVHNFLQMDSIGQDPQLIEQADFQLPMCMKRDSGRLSWINCLEKSKEFLRGIMIKKMPYRNSWL